MKQKNQVVKDYLWNTIGVSLNSFISLFYLIAVTRINGIDTSGIFSYCYSFTLIMYSIVSYGGRTYQLSDAKNEFHDSEYFKVRYITGALGLIITLIATSFMQSGVDKLLIILFFMVVRLVESMSDVLYAIFQKKGRLDYVGKSLTIKNVLSVLSFTIVDLITKNLYISVASLALVTFLVYIFYDRRMLKKLDYVPIKVKKERLTGVLKSTRYYCLFNLVTMLLANLPRFFVEYQFSNAEQGYFGIIIMIPGVTLLLGYMVLQPLMIKLTEAYDQKKFQEFNKLIKKMFITAFALILLCMVCAYFLGPTVLGIMYNMSFENYRWILVLVLLAGLFSMYTTYFSNLLTIMRYTKQQFIMYIIILLVSCVILYFGVQSKFSYVFVAYLICMLVQVLIFFTYFMLKYKKAMRSISKKTPKKELK